MACARVVTPQISKETRAGPVLCESVWLLDTRDTGWPVATGSVSEALEAAHDACEANAASRQVRIAVENAVAVRVGIDTDWLTLVLVNLLDNAVKHGRPGGGVFVSVDVSGRFVRVMVDDDGPGIAATQRERVFAFGERAETEARGSGIGLALVRLLLERAGGRVDVAESPLGGARFVLMLPRE
jgi:two-component system CitB family sensor kinase